MGIGDIIVTHGCRLQVKRVSMSAENFFQRESSPFRFASEALLLVLYGVSEVVCWCFVVTFNVVMRDV